MGIMVYSLFWVMQDLNHQAFIPHRQRGHNILLVLFLWGFDYVPGPAWDSSSGSPWKRGGVQEREYPEAPK